MRGTLRIGRIAGIEIRLHYTWLIAFILITWSVTQWFLMPAYPGWSSATYWITGVIAALLLFVSVLLHELAHSLVAKARGLSVRGITLFIFGGVSRIEEEPEKPMVEFTMAIVGPLASLALAGIFWGIGYALTNEGTQVAAIVTYLMLINLVLGIFNLLPGFPLDGGRVLRSIIWGVTGNLVKATNIAATIGRIFGWGFIVFGMFELLTGNFLGGMWIAFIGWFISSAANASRQEVALRERFSGVSVNEVMDPSPETISLNTSVAEVVRDIFFQQRRRAVPVSQEDRIVGIITTSDVKGLPQHKWAQTVVGQVMTREPIYSVAPQDDLNSAMKLIRQHDLNQVLVFDRRKLVGLLSRADVIRYLQLSQELGMKSEHERRRRHP